MSIGNHPLERVAADRPVYGPAAVVAAASGVVALGTAILGILTLSH